MVGVNKYQVIKGKNTIVTNIEYLPSGVYIIKITSPDNSIDIVTKILKNEN